MKDYPFKTANELVSSLRKGETSIGEITEAAIQRIESLEPLLHAWTFFDPELARAHSEKLQKDYNQQKESWRLPGIPVGVKDIYNSADMPTEMGSLIWKGFRPGNDARVVFNLKYDGANIFGKTKTSEFAVHEPTDTCNPHNLEYPPGTSSAGSAAAVAAGMVPLALGSQTGGSTIRPASYCGIYGFKPTFGTVPRTGVLKTTDTLDTIAWFARSIDDIELLFDVMRVHGPNYPMVNDKLKRSPLPKKLRVGLYKGHTWNQAEPYAQRALLDLAGSLSNSDLFVLEEVELKEDEEIYEDHEIIYCRALSYYFRGEERHTRMSISPVLLRMLDDGEKISPETYLKAVQKQAELTYKFNQDFSFDAWLTLSSGGSAPRGLNSPDRPDSCKIWTYLGAPALSAPFFSSPDGLPFGLQLVGKKYSDHMLLDIGRLIAGILDKTTAATANPLAEKLPLYA
ncbi:MAG: amidase [Elusimicrobia bacterium]|nr:amidase [Candidatus Obscuribacterium magneticum]